MAGLQEVLTASASGAKQIWTLLLEGDAAAPPETRESDSVDALLETAAACVNCAPTALKVHVLLPGGDGEGTVAGGDAVVLICSDRGAPNAKATALLVATGAKDASVAGAACVARFKHDLANPLSVSLGNETAPAFLAERCWLQRARGDTKPEPPSPFPVDARKAVLAQLLAARAAELERRKAAPGNAPQDVKNTGGRVRWTNAKNDVHVAAQLPAGTKRGHCRVVIQAASLSIKVGEVDATGTFRLASLVDGALFQEVDPTQSRWDFVEATAMGTAELQVTLRKKQAMRWLMLVR
jgi:hypothetical protein